LGTQLCEGSFRFCPVNFKNLSFDFFHNP
jgi:hypothetical protein